MIMTHVVNRLTSNITFPSIICARFSEDKVFKELANNSTRAERLIDWERELLILDFFV